MHIHSIHSIGYDAKGRILTKKKRMMHQTGQKKPIDVVMFDSVELSEPQNESYSWLSAYIRNLPDAVVKDKMNNYCDSFESIDHCLIDKIIAEEI